MKIANMNLGKFGFSYKDRFIDSSFTSPDRINSVEFERDYNVSSTASGDEKLRELKISLQPVQQLNISSSYGYLKKGDTFEANRYNNTVSYDFGEKQ